MRTAAWVALAVSLLGGFLPLACTSSPDAPARDAGVLDGSRSDFDARMVVDAGADAVTCQPYDLETFARTDCSCAPIADWCTDPFDGPLYGPADLCALTLTQVDDAATWGGTGNCDITQSTNVCANDTQIVLGGGVDFFDELFYDQSGRLVGALELVNGPQKCWGTVPPIDCFFTGSPDAGTCCDWSPQILFDAFDAGVCYPANGPLPIDGGDD